MPSPIEQFFASFSGASWRKAHALRRGLLFLLLAFIAMRLGTFIPLPGVDSAAWASYFGSFSNLPLLP